MARDMTWLDDCKAVGIREYGGEHHLPVDGVEMGDSVYRAMGDTWLDRASPELYDELVRMYTDARMADDPMFIDDYPDEDEIARYLNAGETWVLRLRSSGEPVGACVLTQEAVLGMDAEIILRGQTYREHTPGENWFYGGSEYFLMKNYVVRPPLHPYSDIVTLVEYAARAAATMGVYELRMLANLRDRTMCAAMRMTGSVTTLLARRANNEAYVGYDMYRSPNADDGPQRHPYCSPAFEKLTQEEYREMLDKMGMDREVDDAYLKYRHRDEDDD